MRGRWGKWIAGTVTVGAVLVGATVGAFRIDRLGDEADDARARLQKVEEQIEERDRRLGQAQEDLARGNKRLARFREDLRRSRRSYRQLYRLTSRNFCFNDDVGLSAGFVRGPLIADVDGDGTDDRVFATSRLAPITGVCRYFLVVRTESTTHKLRVGPRDLSVTDFSLEGYLHPEVAAQLDGRPGAELLVVVHQGAAMVFGAVYTFADGNLQRLDIPDEESDSFGYAGSLCCGGAVDCTDDPGEIVYSTYGRAKGNRGYDVKRRFYTVSSSGFSLTDTEMRHLPEGDLERFEEFGTHALANCPLPADIAPLSKPGRGRTSR